MLELIKKYRRFITYSAVGVINTIVDFLVFTLFKELTAWPSEYCQICGYAGGILCSFILNKLLTFRRGATTSLPVQAWRFIIVNAVSLGASMLIIKLLESVGVNTYIAKLMTSVVTMLINYVGYKLFVFSIKKDQ